MSLALGSEVEVLTRPRNGAPGAGRTRRRLSTLVALALGGLCALALATAASAAAPPTNLRASSAGKSTITLSWNGVQATYGTYLNGRYIANTKLFSYRFTGLSCGRAYTLGARTVPRRRRRLDHGHHLRHDSVVLRLPLPQPEPDARGACQHGASEHLRHDRGSV